MAENEQRRGVIIISAPRELIKAFGIKTIENNATMKNVLTEYIKEYIKNPLQMRGFLKIS